MAQSSKKCHFPESSDTDGVQKSVEEVADNSKPERQNAVPGDAEKLVLTGPEITLESPTPTPAREPPYSIFTHWQKVGITLMVSFFALISPLSGQIYLPALTQLSDDLGVTISLINLTITTYMIFQGITPSFIGSFSDVYGRRPAYVICFGIYVVANIGLALQDSYGALMGLRCLQSMGSSATVALSSATVADMVTRAERGRYIGYAAMGVTLGPAFGPIAGGLLTQYYGWRGTFWFLVILSGTLFAIMLMFLPETGRTVVGNGSVSPPWWNMSGAQLIRRSWNSKKGKADAAELQTLQTRRRRPNPFASLQILLEREGGITLGCGSLLSAGYFMILTTLSPQLTERFNYSPVQVGLCYLPLGLGLLSSRWTVGTLLDWNFRRWARKLGLEIDRTRQQNLDELPIEKMRLQISLCAIYACAAAVIAYGWTMQLHANLGGILTALFFLGLCLSGAMNGINTLIVDTHPQSPATAVAANNLFRCLVSAGATAMALPLIERIGIGWTGVFIAGVYVCFSPLVWLVMLRGASWRREDQEKKKARAAQAEQMA